MIDEKIAYIIEDLKHNTVEAIENIQLASTPHFVDLKPKRVFTYVYNGAESPVSHKQILISADSLPYKSLYKRRNKLVFKDKFIDMINKNEIHPFLVFINGKFIKWSKIEIWSDYRKDYISINESFKTVNSISILYIPFNVYYSESGKNNSKSTSIFSFNNTTGLLDPIGTTVISVDNKDIFYEEYTSDMGLRSVELELDPKYKLCESNILVFKQGSPYTNPSIRLDGLNIFTIDNGEYTSATKMTCKIFYNMKGNTSKDNVLNVSNKDYIKDILKSRHYGGTIPLYLDNLMKPFDLKSDGKNYEEITLNYLLDVMLYNSSLLDIIYKDTSNIISILYSGKEINSKITKDKYLKMPRRRVDNHDDYVMIFVNGELYKNYNLIVYENNFFKIPFGNIDDTDTIELIFFKNINNMVYKAKITKPESYTILDPDIDLNNLKIYSQTVDIADYYLKKNERIQYEVEYTIEYIDGKPKIVFTSEYFYNRPVTLVSSNQFRYVGFNILKESVSVLLSPDFNYCHDINRYMVFVNGRKANKENFKVTITAPSVPFTNISVYVQLPLLVGDRIDVFYLPSILDEIVLEPTIPISGDIVIDKTKISYNLDKDLYLFFVNGKKINNRQMIDISPNRLIINSDIKSIQNLCVIKHIPDNVMIKELFDSNESIWDDIINAMSKEEIYTILDVADINISSLEEDIFANNYPIASVIREIVRDYWLRSKVVDAGEVFIYDYDKRVLEGEDIEGNVLIPVMDAHKEDNILIEE